MSTTTDLFLYGRLHALREPVYTQREAEMAAGQGSYHIPPSDAAHSTAAIERVKKKHSTCERISDC